MNARRRDAVSRLDWLIRLEQAAIASSAPGASPERLEELKQIRSEVMALLRAARA